MNLSYSGMETERKIVEVVQKPLEGFGVDDRTKTIQVDPNNEETAQFVPISEPDEHPTTTHTENKPKVPDISTLKEDKEDRDSMYSRKNR